MYLLIAAVSTTVSYLSVHFICKQDNRDFSREEEFAIKKPSGCCGYADNKISWYQMIHWFFFTIGNEAAFIVTILYWIVIYCGEAINGVYANVHLVNGLIAFIDFWVSGIPVNFLHFIYLVVFGAVYAVMTGIYFAATNNIIYQALDYEDGVGYALGAIIAAVVITHIIHFFFFFMYLGKHWMLYCYFRRRKSVNSNEQLDLLSEDQSGKTEHTSTKFESCTVESNETVQ